MTITLDFIVKRASDKFIDDLGSDLYKYKRILETSIRKGGEKKEEKRLLAEVNRALGDAGETVEVMKAVKEPKDDYKTRQRKKETFYKKAAIEAIEEHFDFD